VLLYHTVVIFFDELKRCWLAACMNIFDCIIHCAITGYNLNYNKDP